MLLRQVWTDDVAQDIAEYALMLAILLTITILSIQAIGSNAQTMMSRCGSLLKAASN
jgi:hypothetical protein